MTNIVPCMPPRPVEAAPSPAGPPSGGWPAVTIVTPSLNGAAFVKRAIDSVLEQGYPAVEHIVVDGGSTDGTRDILASYPHLRVFVEADRGSHHAMNKGLAAATGAIVGFLNTDDFYAPGFLHAAARRLAAGDARLAAGRCFLVSDRGGEPAVEAELRHAADPDLYFFELLYGTPGFNAYFFDRRLLAGLSGFDERFEIAADRDFLIRAALAGHHPAFLPERGYYYRRHAGSRTLDYAARLAESILADHRRIAAKHLADPTLTPAHRRALRRWHAWETARLVSCRCTVARFAQGVSLAVRALAENPGWPARVPGALAARRRLARACEQPTRHRTIEA